MFNPTVNETKYRRQANGEIPTLTHHESFLQTHREDKSAGETNQQQTNEQKMCKSVKQKGHLQLESKPGNRLCFIAPAHTCTKGKAQTKSKSSRTIIPPTHLHTKEAKQAPNLTVAFALHFWSTPCFSPHLLLLASVCAGE